MMDMMTKKTKPSEKDLAAFYQAVQGTKPLSQKNTKIKLTKPIPSITIPVEKPPTITFNFSDLDEIEGVRANEFIFYHQPGISQKILRKLRKGQYNVQAMLDLHGMTVETARLAVLQFIQQCLQKSMRVALIIHGKGARQDTPILKNKLNQWLRSTNTILAFCSATPGDGSSGAVYVLLKSQSLKK